jgi:phage gpG-like protein
MAEIEYMDEGWRDFILEIEADTEAKAFTAVRNSAEHLRNAIVTKLSGQRTGRIYPVPGTGDRDAGTAPRYYQASAPGEPPASMLGNLRKSIAFTDPERVGDEMRSAVGVDGKAIPYAARLEFGGRGERGGYIAPRPYLRSTFLEQEQAVEDIIRKELAR